MSTASVHVDEQLSKEPKSNLNHPAKSQTTKSNQVRDLCDALLSKILEIKLINPRKCF